MNLGSGARVIPRRLRASHDSAVKERGEQDARDRLSILMDASFLASRAAVSDQGPPRLVGGRVSAPDPGLARGFSPGEVGRVRPSPDPLPALQGGPAVVRGGRIRRRWSSDTRGPPNWPWPPEPGGHVPLRPQAPLPSHPNDASRERPPADGTGEM